MTYSVLWWIYIVLAAQQINIYFPLGLKNYHILAQRPSLLLTIHATTFKDPDLFAILYFFSIEC